MIILLDLNSALVDAPYPRPRSTPGRPFVEIIAEETYRQWLVEIVRGLEVVLITPRPDAYRADTLANLALKALWTPGTAIFNTQGLSPAPMKQAALREIVFRRYSETPRDSLLAVEGNPACAAMYRRNGIRVAVPEAHPWKNLAAIIEVAK